MILGRDKELKLMNDLYNKGGFQLLLLYGRRRIGKTTLITEFIKNKKSIFFSAEQDTKENNMNKFSKIVFDYFSVSNLENFKSFDNLLLYIIEQIGNEKLVLVIDELPYFCKYYKSLLSSLQHIIDHKLKKTNIYLILCGSYMSFMENEVLGEKSPIFGRRTAQMKLKELDYLDASLFFKKKNAIEKSEIYGALGGTALYLSLYNNELSFKENINDLYLKSIGYLYEEAKILLKQEIEEPYTYNAIIEAIAHGYTKANEIATKIGEETSKCIKYINTLIGLGLIIKETPFDEKENNRKTIYQISDLMFRFWYRYVFSNHSLIEQDGGKVVFEKIIMPTYNDYMGHVFEKICIQYLNRANILGKLPFIFTKVGRWWGSDKKTKKQVEIDIVASDGNKNYLFCECKWTNEKVGESVLKELEYNSNIFNDSIVNKKYILFSKSGWTESLIKESQKREDLILVSVDNIYKLNSK